jgi:DNA-binding transcriptional ArsR family regulator
MALVEVFKALGDPIRLEMVDRLSSGASHTITSLSRGLKISRQGLRKHLQVLVDSDLVTLSPHGRNTAVRLDKRSLERSKAFITRLERRWEKRLEALRDHIEKQP